MRKQTRYFDENVILVNRHERRRYKALARRRKLPGQNRQRGHRRVSHQ